MPDKSITFAVTLPDGMTLGDLRALREYLLELCKVEDDDGVLVCTGTVGDIVGKYGDYGPEDWSCRICGVPSDGCELHREAIAVYEALALDAWWTDAKERIESYCGQVTDDPIPSSETLVIATTGEQR